MMNRVIKFRAWDKETKTLDRVTSLDFPEWSVSVQKENDFYCSERNSFKNEETDRFMLMQFTGLKDKNGVDIYEGDIVKSYGEMIKVFAPKHQQKTGVFKASYKAIEYRESKGSFCIVGSALSGISQKICTEHYEVAGNIYESPELLEVKK